MFHSAIVHVFLDNSSSSRGNCAPIHAFNRTKFGEFCAAVEVLRPGFNESRRKSVAQKLQLCAAESGPPCAGAILSGGQHGT
jgi:hypothetical protein